MSLLMNGHFSVSRVGMDLPLHSEETVHRGSGDNLYVEKGKIQKLMDSLLRQEHSSEVSFHV